MSWWKRLNMRPPLADKARNSATHPHDEDRTAWDLAWSSQTVRRLTLPSPVDLKVFAEWGEPIGVTFSSVPAQYVDRVLPPHGQCPVCGVEPDIGSRVPISLLMTFSQHSLGRTTWAHADCVATCEEVPCPAGIPW